MSPSPSRQHPALAQSNTPHSNSLSNRPSRATATLQVLTPAASEATASMLPKTLFLAAAWWAMSGSLAQATPLQKFARARPDEGAPGYCRPVNGLQGYDDYYYMDFSAGSHHSV
jgi:hypothetical protein